MATAKKAAPKKAAPKKTAPKKSAINTAAELLAAEKFDQKKFDAAVEKAVQARVKELQEKAEKAKKEFSKFILKSTQQNDAYIHYKNRLNAKDHEYRIMLGSNDAHVFDKEELEEFLDTLPENNGLEVIGVA